MNPYTGHMVTVASEEAMARLAQEYERIPKKLMAAAEAALDGKPETYIDLRKRGPLQEWAKKKRKAKIAAKSRRINRA